MRTVKVLALFFVEFAFMVALVHGQTVNTGTVLGTVTDAAGAVVPDADIELRGVATGAVSTQKTNGAGQYIFPNVAPGVYQITVKKQGFRNAVLPQLTVNVSKSYIVDLKLQVGSITEVVQVRAEAHVELQTTDAQVGDVIAGTTLERLPTLARDARELLTLQPGVTPYDPPDLDFGNSGGTVTGARSDQNVFSLDGIDITDNVIAGGGTQVPIVPINVESVEEFRVGVSNPNATFGRSAGGQVALITKRGTNDFHGSAYWFHQNDDLNANSWTNNRNGIKKAEQKDNRGGFQFGGPFIKQKTFFFVNYEIRRFPQSSDVQRIVPTDMLRKGILQFKDAMGNTVAYDLKSSTLCNAGATACDPRGIGISPAVQGLWNVLPTGGDNSVAGVDKLNTTGFRDTLSRPRKADFIRFRLDHSFTPKIRFFGRYDYSRDLQINGGQLDIRNNKATGVSQSQIRGDGAVGGLDWLISNTLSNTFRFGWIRSRQNFTAFRPSGSATQLAIAGTNTTAGFVALEPTGASGPGGILVDTPVDVDTQRARNQAILDRNKQLVEAMTWIHGTHTMSFGAEVRWLPTVHPRDDKVIGSLNSLVALMDGDVNVAIPAANRPPTCDTMITTNCLLASDVSRWDRLYAAALGLVDNVGILIARDGSLNPLPFGTQLVADTTLRAYHFFFQDTWRPRPSLTFTYGLAYGWQTPPKDKLGRQTFIVNHDNHDQILTAQQYLNAKAAAAREGKVFNPTLAYLPINKSGRDGIFNIDRTNWAPRLALAWAPSYQKGFLHKLFGERRTAVRTGFGIAYDRINTVGSVIIPELGVGFAQTISIIAPLCDASGMPGIACNPSGGNPGLASFRVGVDGNIPIPTVPTVSSPVVPSAPLGEILSFLDDPDAKVGRNYLVDFSIQRELPGNMLLEIGYVGRLARDLLNNVNFNSVPYFFKDSASGQTFAQAFDAVATALRNGQTVTPQPWFDNQLPGLGTNFMATNFPGLFIDGRVSSMFLFMELFAGSPAYNNLQVLDLFMRTHRDLSNYHALLLTLHKRVSHGLEFNFNYTLSKSLDQIGTVQNSASYFASSFTPNLEYGPSFFDRRHVFNAWSWYDLPFGKGRWLSSRHNWLDKFISGWYTASVFRANTGNPIHVTEGSEVFGAGIIFGIAQDAIPLVDPNTLNAGVHSGVAGSGGVGTAGDPASKGSGLNLFADPSKAFDAYRKILISKDGRTGRGNAMHGLGLWNLDMRFGKATSIRERVKVEYSFDLFNIFNHVNFVNPSLDLTNKATFGVITDQLVPADRLSGSRWIQFGLRIAF